MTEDKKGMSYAVAFFLLSLRSRGFQIFKSYSFFQCNKAILRQDLSNSICDLFFDGNILKADLSFSLFFINTMMLDIYMLCARMELEIFGKGYTP